MINMYCQMAFANATEKGFYSDDPNPDPLSKLMLIVSELGEACEAVRKNDFIANRKNITPSLYRDLTHSESDTMFNIRFELYIKDTFEDEIADAVIRIFDMCGNMGIDLRSHIDLKMRYNKSRPYKHGKTC